MSAMKKCSSSLDRLSDLPSNITESILMFLPMRDMVRTSVLSKKWRLRWVQVPELIFENDSKMFQSLEERDDDNLNIVVGILFQHHGPIKKFKLDLSRWKSCCGIGKIFQFLSRNGVQDLNLMMPRTKFRLPSSIYSCRELKHLSLKYCSLQPLTLVGFNKLVTLELLNVDLDRHVTISGCPFLQYLLLTSRTFVALLTIDCPNLISLVVKYSVYSVCIKKAPLLRVLLVSVHKLLLEKEIKFIEFLASFPLLENLSLSHDCVQSMARDSPNELQTTLEKIRMLRLTNIDLYNKDQLSSVLRLIRSSPNLQKLEITEFYQAKRSQQRQLSLQMPNSCNYCLVKLRKAKFELTTDPRGYIEFYKFILAVSPELETLYIKPASRDDDLSCCKILLKLASTRRVSPKANIVFIGLDLDN